MTRSAELPSPAAWWRVHSLPLWGLALAGLVLVLGTLTLGSGLATVMQGAVHLVLFAAFLFLTVVP